MTSGRGGGRGHTLCTHLTCTPPTCLPLPHALAALPRSQVPTRADMLDFIWATRDMQVGGLHGGSL